VLPTTLFKITALFAITAVAEIVGCYLIWLIVKQDKPSWFLLPAICALAFFAWLLTLHPSAAGRVYAAYAGVYLAVALVWLRWVEGVALTSWDLAGAAVSVAGMAIIVLQPVAR
jgi:small multidrug resistance family-3 protein